jgi:TrmH family RNA methyltransferase
VLRSADAAGVSALVVADPRTDLFNPNTIRASLGAIFTMPACCAAATEVRDWFLGQRISVFAARVDAKRLYTEADFKQPAAIVLGSEAEGLSAIWTGTGVTPIRLSMRGRTDSLNVSATAAVLFYEALRQRQPEGPNV